MSPTPSDLNVEGFTHGCGYLILISIRIPTQYVVSYFFLFFKYLSSCTCVGLYELCHSLRNLRIYSIVSSVNLC